MRGLRSYAAAGGSGGSAFSLRTGFERAEPAGRPASGKIARPTAYGSTTARISLSSFGKSRSRWGFPSAKIRPCLPARMPPPADSP